MSYNWIEEKIKKYKEEDFFVLKFDDNNNIITGGNLDNNLKDTIIVGAGPIGLWSAILLLKFKKARRVYILEKRLDKEMWNKRKYIVKINNGYLKQIEDLYDYLNKNKVKENKRKDDYSIKNLSFEKILENYKENEDKNKYEKQYNEENPDPRNLEYDQDFYAISNFQKMLKRYLDEKYKEQFKILAYSNKMIKYNKEKNNLEINVAEFGNMCEQNENVEIDKIIDCSGTTSYLMNKILGIKYNEKKATNYGVGIKINWNKTKILENYEKQEKIKKNKNFDEKKYKHYRITKANISNIEFEDAHIPTNVLNAKVLFSECIKNQNKLLLDAKYNINKKTRKSYLPFKRTILEADTTIDLILERDKYKDLIGQFQRDALRLFWKECVEIYNNKDNKEKKEKSEKIKSFFSEMKKRGMIGMDGYEFIKHMQNIDTFGSLCIICYILNHFFYCRFIPELKREEDIIYAKKMYVIDEDNKNIKNIITNENYLKNDENDKYKELFIESLKELKIAFIPERVEQILSKNLIYINSLKTNIHKIETKCKTYYSNNVKVFAIGDSLFSTDFSLGMGVNRGLSTALQIIRDNISPERIRKEIEKYIHPKLLPKNTDWKLLYNLNSNYYFYIETIIKNKNKIKRKHRLKWRKEYLKYIINIIKKKKN
jgi:hypothetical protein